MLRSAFFSFSFSFSDVFSFPFLSLLSFWHIWVICGILMFFIFIFYNNYLIFFLLFSYAWPFLLIFFLLCFCAAGGGLITINQNVPNVGFWQSSISV
ncbi:MAG: hypothetical protein CMJ52_02220 [Planctomycetaceae bacterium]|nr:hypothetical protein [Planctomycetaceae bacterium]